MEDCLGKASGDGSEQAEALSQTHQSGSTGRLDRKVNHYQHHHQTSAILLILDTGLHRTDTATAHYATSTHIALRKTSVMSARSGSIVIPEWQDDAEVTACPICKRTFHFLFRKHHCRRCGRIICNECSPHRITLPRQYIVRPPYEPPPPQLADDDEEPDVSNPALGGGETVRVCNPCVPDPNYGPPPQQAENTLIDASRAPLPIPSESQVGYGRQRSPFVSPQRSPERNHPDRYRTVANIGSPSQRSEGARVYYSRRSNSNAGPIPAHQVLDARWRRRTNRTSSDLEPHPGSMMPPALPTGSRPIPGVALAASPSRSRPAPYSSLPTMSRMGSQSDHRGMRPPLIQDVAPWEAPPPLPRRRRQQIREEDECPVCGTQDPPFGPDGDQTQRERHIETCITDHLQFSSTPRATAHPPPGPERTATAPPASTGAAPPTTENPASSAIAALGSTDPSHPALPVPGPSTSTATPTVPPTTRPPGRPRTNTPAQRMLVYHATEKDCFDASGGAQECVICFEEFEVGQEMGRLECLCKFHRGCIRGWWESASAGGSMAGQGAGGGGSRWGSCPTHTLIA